MATKILTGLLSRNDQLLYEVKKGIKSQGEKQSSQILQKLPSKQTLESQFSTKIISTQEEFDTITKKYNKTKKFLNESKSKLDASKDSLLKLKSKIQKVEAALSKINSIFEKLNILIKTLDFVIQSAKVIVTVIGAIPSTVASPNPAGPIIKANDILKLSDGKVKVFKVLIKSISGVLPHYLGKVTENFSILDKALTLIEGIIQKITILILVLELLFLELLKKQALNNPNKDNQAGSGDATSGVNAVGGGKENLDDTQLVDPLDQAQTPEELLNLLSDPTKTEYMEYEKEGNVVRSFKRIKK